MWILYEQKQLDVFFYIKFTLWKFNQILLYPFYQEPNWAARNTNNNIDSNFGSSDCYSSFVTLFTPHQLQWGWNVEFMTSAETRKANLLLIYPTTPTPKKAVLFQNLLFWSDQTMITSDSSVIVVLPIKAGPPICAPPSPHFSLLPFADRTQRPQKFDSSLCAGAREFPARSCDPGQGITKWFYGLFSTHTPASNPELSASSSSAIVFLFWPWWLSLSLLLSVSETIHFITTLANKL